MAGPGKAGKAWAWLGEARQGEAGPGTARQGKVWRGCRGVARHG